MPPKPRQPAVPDPTTDAAKFNLQLTTPVASSPGATGGVARSSNRSGRNMKAIRGRAGEELPGAQENPPRSRRSGVFADCAPECTYPTRLTVTLGDGRTGPEGRWWSYASGKPPSTPDDARAMEESSGRLRGGRRECGGGGRRYFATLGALAGRAETFERLFGRLPQSEPKKSNNTPAPRRPALLENLSDEAQ